MTASIVVGIVVLGALLAAAASAVGISRMPDIYNQLHAAAIVPFLTLVPLGGLVVLQGDPWLSAKTLLVVISVMTTSGASAHVIARAARAREHGAREPASTNTAVRDAQNGRS